jgi:hypothetical protein
MGAKPPGIDRLKELPTVIAVDQESVFVVFDIAQVLPDVVIHSFSLYGRCTAAQCRLKGCFTASQCSRDM